MSAYHLLLKVKQFLGARETIAKSARKHEQVSAGVWFA
jgi:hypothetical protein